MANTDTSLQALPSQEEITLARACAEVLSQFLAKLPRTERAQVRMAGQDLIMPRSALELLRDLLAEMAQGNVVNIVPIHHLLTTQDAANLLNVSRPFLIQLLEQKKMPFSKVGTHRRIRYEDLMMYKRKCDRESAKLLDELTREAQEDDLGY